MGLLLVSVVVHWIPAKLSAISSPCHRASINQYAPQAARGTRRGNNTPHSHAYLNIQGLLVAADWTPHHGPAPKTVEEKKAAFGRWSACDSPMASTCCTPLCECVCSYMTCSHHSRAQRCVSSRHHYRDKCMIFKNHT